MDDKEIRAIKARLAYQEYVSQLPRCDICESCMIVTDYKLKKRVCKDTFKIVDTRIQTCPAWCPKREENRQC